MDNNYTLQLATRSPYLTGSHQAPKPSLASILKQAVTNAALSWLLPMLLLVFSASIGLNAQTVTAFNPTSGVTGTTVTITGTDFTNVSAVAFNGVNSAYFVSSTTTILAQVPAGATTGNVCVTTNVGTGCSAFNFIIGAPVPSITSFSPTSGNIGTNVSITGQNFTGVDSVQFNGTKVTSFTVNSSTNISATVPVGATTGPIRIFTSAGNVTSSTNFNILNGGGAGPVITNFSPTSGPVGTTVTITGLNLGAVTSVFIGGISCTITGSSSTSLTITIPSGAPTAIIQVLNAAGGAQTATSFTVTGAAGLCFAGTPTTLAMPFTTSWQNALARTGNATLTTFTAVANETYSLSLCNTTLDTYIRIYNAAGNEVNFNDDNGPYCTSSSASIDWICPTTGTYRILITGYSCAPLSSDVIVAFKRGTANSNPTITNFTPTSGFTGTVVTINGTNLDQITGATISGVNATLGTQTASALQITVGPGTTTGPIVLTYSGGSISTSPSVFTVTGSCVQISSNSGPITPTLNWQSISPAAGFVNRYSFTAAAGDVYSFRTCNTTGTANTKLRILDAGFNEVAVFDDNGAYCTGNKASGDFTTTTSGTYYVLLSIANCTAPTSAIVLDYKFTPTTPTITSFAPISGPVGTTVTLTGTNLSGVTSITINGAVQNVTSISSTTIIFNIATGTNTGLIQLNYSGGSVLSSTQFTVVTSAACYANTTFSRTLVPTSVWQTLSGLAGTSPRYGINGVAGRTYNFSTCATTGDTKLRIYDASGNELSSYDDNGPYCTGGSASGDYTPATSGLFYVGLTQYDCNPLAVTTILSYKQDVINALPTIISFTPTSGPVGTTVTVSGTNFNFVTSVLVNGVASGSINIVSGTQLTFVVPAGATTGVITLNYGGGSVSSTTNFTVTATSTCFAISSLNATLSPTLTWSAATPPVGIVRRYGFTGTVGNTYNFSTCATGALNPTRIRIYDNNGVELAVYSGNGPYCNTIRASGDFTPTTSGSYFVVISDFDCNVLSASTTVQYKYTPATVTPTLISFSPASGTIGSSVTLTGTQLQFITQVRINGTLATITSQSANAITITVASGTTTGLITLTYGTGSITSSSVYTVNAAASCFAASAYTGDITFSTTWQTSTPPIGVIRRYGFNATVGNTYSFSTCTATGTNATRIRIYNALGVELAVYSGNGPHCTGSKASGDFTPTSSGPYFVVFSNVDCNLLSQTTPLQYRFAPTVVTPTITSINPASGPIGSTVTVSGTDLLNLASIEINGVTQILTPLNSTTANITIQAGTTTGLVSGTYTGGVVLTTLTFTVTTASTCYGSTINAGTLTPNASWQSLSVPAGSIRRWLVNGVAGTTYNFNTCNNTATNDNKIRIYDPSGNEITFFDDNGPYCATSKASGDYTPGTSGTFWVSLSDYDCNPLSQANTVEYKLTAPFVAPTITSFSPASGPVGTQVTITGSNLGSITLATINGVGAGIVTQTANSIVITVGAGTTTGLITLAYPGGTVSSTSNFVVTTAPTYCYSPATNRGNLTFSTANNSVTGNIGTAPYWSFVASPGNIYRISTCGTSNDTKLRIYDGTLTEVASNDDNGPVCTGAAASIEFIPSTTGVYSVLLTSFDCIPLSASTGMSYQLVPSFAVRTVTPSSGYVFDNVQIKGAGFLGATNVGFSGGASPATFVVVNDSTITATVPAAAVTGTVCVTSASGQTLCTGSVFTVLTLPTLCNAADYAGRLTMTTTFQALNLNVGFRPTFVFNTVAGRTYTFRTCGSTGTNDTKIRIYDLAGTEIFSNDDNGPYCTGNKASVDFVAPGTGSYYVMVTDYQCDPVSQTIFFEYRTSSAAPVITSFTPTSGPIGTNVTITGVNFTGATSASFNAILATGLSVVNSTTATAIVSAGSTTGFIRLTTPAGTAVSPSTFVVTASLPTITSFTPTSGPIGTVVTLTGTNFTGATSVTINGTAATGLTVLSSTSARATVAAGTTTGPVRIITPSGSAFGPFNYVVTVVCNLRLSITGQSGSAISATISNGTAPYRYSVNGGATINSNTATTGLSIVANSRNVITVTDANNCTATTAFYFNSAVSCGSRLLPSATDSVTMFFIAGSSGTTSIMFDGATFPTSSQLFASGSQVGTTSAVGANPSNLVGFTGANAVAIVRAPIGTAWQAWLTCNTGSTAPRTNIGSSATSTCNSALVFSSFPFRQTSVIGSIAQSLSPSVAGQAVKLDIDAVRLEAGQRIDIFYNLTGIGAPVATITGNYSTNSVFSWTSNAASGALYLRFTGTNSNQFPGIVGRVSCVPLVLPNAIRLGTLASTSVCAGSTLNVPVVLTGSYTYPVTATAYLSDGSGSFASPLSVGTASLTSANGLVSASIPTSLVLPGSYRLRVDLTAPVLRSDTVSLTINAIPAAPTVSTPAGTTACAGQIVLLEGPFGATGYLWSNSQTTRQIRVQPGSYTLSITTNGCPSPASAPVTVTNLPTPVAAFTQQNDTLFATPTGATYQWLYNNGIIPGATGPFLKVSFNGAYSVIVTQGTCADTSASQLINSLSANQLGALRLVLYPNPASKLVTLVAQPEAWRSSRMIIVTNALGQTVLQLPASPSVDGAQPIDIAALPAGRYMVSLKGSGSYQTLVVQ